MAVDGGRRRSFILVRQHPVKQPAGVQNGRRAETLADRMPAGRLIGLGCARTARVSAQLVTMW